MQAFQFTPIIKQYRWGGRALGTVLKKTIGHNNDYAESWEIVDHNEDQSTVVTGKFENWTLNQLIQKHKNEILGSKFNASQFPLLIKFLDCNDRLSVQVHPNDQQAESYVTGENGKSEAWVILQAQPESVLYAGLKKGVTKEALATAIENGSAEQVLHKVHPKPGDCFFIPAGTVHALGEGILLAEVQQSSDLTFRLYDWERVDQQGKLRPLHIDQAMKCINFTQDPVHPITPSPIENKNSICEQLVCSKHFNIQRWTFKSTHQIELESKFHIVICIKGNGQMICDQEESVPLKFGQTFLIPAITKAIRFTPKLNAPLQLLLVTQ